MIIDKVKPFWTEEDRQRLQEIREKQLDYIDSFIEHEKELNELEDSENRLLWEIENRYISSGADFIKDAEEIVETIEQADFKTFLKSREEIISALEKALEKGKYKEIARKNLVRIRKIAIENYENCYFFILSALRVQLNATEGNEDAQGAIKDIVAAGAARWYEPEELLPEAQEVLPIKSEEIKGDFFTLPSGPALELLYDVLGSRNIDNLPLRKKKYNRNQKLTVMEQGDKRRISYTKEKATISVEVDDFQKIANCSPKTEKILSRILSRANEQAIFNGELYRDKVSFPLRDLVGEGQYKNIETARQGFYNVTDTLTGLKVSGKIEKGKKKTIQQGAHVVLFKAAKVDNATCEVYLNELLNWGLIAPYYMDLPDYYYELPDRAASLLRYIFYLARQNAEQIEKNGFFTISYRAIQYQLRLPNEDSIRNTKRDIKDAIEKAIEQIEEAYCKYSQPIPEDAKGKDAIPDFSLEPSDNYNAPIKEYLDEGKLKVSLKGDYATRLIELSQKTAAKIEAAKKKWGRIEERAIALKMAKNDATEQAPQKAKKAKKT